MTNLNLQLRNRNNCGNPLVIRHRRGGRQNDILAKASQDLGKPILGTVVAEAVNYTVYTPEEQLVLKELKSFLGEQYDNYNGPFKSDAYLIHVIRARNGDAQKSVQLVREIMTWRYKNGIDNLLEEDFSKFRKQHPYYIDDGALNGEPIVTVAIWDIRRIMLGGLKDYSIRYVDRIFEEGIQHTLNVSKTLGREITQAIFIADLSAYTPRTHACLACLAWYTDFLYHFENLYPQSTSSSFFLNTPRIFDSLLQILRPLMSTYTQQTMKVYGVNKEEYSRELFKLIPADRLRIQFGGKLHD